MTAGRSPSAQLVGIGLLIRHTTDTTPRTDHMVTRIDSMPADGPTAKYPEYPYYRTVTVLGVEVDARIGEWSTQHRRRSARAFLAAVAAGQVANTPAGCRLEKSEDRGAVFVLPDGSRHAVNSWWCLSRIMVWWDDCVDAEGRRVLHAVGYRIEQVSRKWAVEVGEWISAEAWMAPEIIADRQSA
jgi:hypothetical protein